MHKYICVEKSLLNGRNFLTTKAKAIEHLHVHAVLTERTAVLSGLSKSHDTTDTSCSRLDDR